MGRAVTVEGRPAGVAFFELGGDVGRRAVTLAGRARWCDRDRHIREYRLSGRPATWRGAFFRAELRAAIERTSGLGPGDLQGEWTGDEVRATTPLVRLGGTVTVDEGSAARTPIAHYRLHRGTESEFEAACREP